jgi:hypothetical protein
MRELQEALQEREELTMIKPREVSMQELRKASARVRDAWQNLILNAYSVSEVSPCGNRATSYCEGAKRRPLPFI